MPLNAQPPHRQGTVGHPYSALNLRLVLALFGLITSAVFAVLLFRSDIAAFGWIFVTLAVIAATAATVDRCSSDRPTTRMLTKRESVRRGGRNSCRPPCHPNSPERCRPLRRLVVVPGQSVIVVQRSTEPADSRGSQIGLPGERPAPFATESHGVRPRGATGRRISHVDVIQAAASSTLPVTSMG
jgi:hypothetical protein